MYNANNEKMKFIMEVVYNNLIVSKVILEALNTLRVCPHINEPLSWKMSSFSSQVKPGHLYLYNT